MIDPRAGTLITNIPLGGKPEYGASAGDGKLYANLTDTSEVVEIDAKTATVSRAGPLLRANNPSPWPSTLLITGCSADAGAA